MSDGRDEVDRMARAGHDLRATEQAVLDALRAEGCPLTLAELEVDTTLTRHAVGRAVNSLADRGLVKGFIDGGDTLWELKR